jgi:PAP2 superfamily
MGSPKGPAADGLPPGRLSSPTTGMTRRQLLVSGGVAAGGVAAVALGLPAISGSAAASAENFDAEVPVAWFDLMRTLTRSTAGFTPPVASRAFAYAGITLYEAVVAGSATHRSLHGILPDMPELPSPPGHLHWPTAANSALASMIRSLYPTASDANKKAVNFLESVLAKRSGGGRIILDSRAAVAHGRAVAKRIFAWSKSDGGHEAYLRNYPPGYVLPTGPGLWVPTPPGFSPPMLPTWGQNRCFALYSPDACAAGNPTPYSEHPPSQFYADAQEVYEAVNTLSQERAAAAWFWSDDPTLSATPAGHSISIATQVIRRENASLMTAAETYARVGMAVADAFIACWRTKYQHNLLRPVTYINQHIDARWLPLLITPPFPEHTSGHSVQSAAAFRVLADLFDDSYPLDDHTHDERGMTPRHFNSFTEAAREAAFSRLYGGIHYRPAIELGLAQGWCIGQAVSGLPLQT